LSTENIMAIKERIIGWLKEEACSPTEQPDPNSYFNIAIKMGVFKCLIVQPVQKTDSIIAVSRVILPPDMLGLLKAIDSEKRTELFWNLRLSILKNSELLEFNIESDSTDDIKSVTLISRPVFYDEMTKSRLFSAIYAVTRATLMVMFTLQKYSGKMPSKKDEQKLSYSS
jgi:hypothetical protein